MSKRGIVLQATAGEAHWQLGITERMIGTIFSAAEWIMSETSTTLERAVSLAIMSQNTIDRVRGYSPSLWAFGRQPNWAGEMFEGKDEVNLARDSSEAFNERMTLERKARKLYEEQLLNDRLTRAKRAQNRPDKVLTPGESVFAWRQGTHKLAGSRKTGIHQGAWFGPATVLGTESKVHEGTVVPSAIVWVIVNDRLWRCAPQQLRRSSERVE